MIQPGPSIGVHTNDPHALTVAICTAPATTLTLYHGRQLSVYD